MDLPSDVVLGECRVSRRTGLDPFDQCIVIERADRYVLVAEAFLANLDERFAHFGDGILTLHGCDGDVSYGLSHHDPALQQYLGTRAGD